MGLHGLAFALTAAFASMAATGALSKGLRHELAGSIDYVSSKGAAGSGDQEAATATEQGTMTVSAAYGYILTNLVEPIIEAKYSATNTKVATFSGTDVKSEYGLGVLFNVPIGSRKPPKKDDASDDDKGRDEGPQYRWLPYGGILISKVGFSQARSGGVASQSDSGEIVTKLVFGNRYFLFPNVALNTSARISYQTNKTTQSGDGENPGVESTSNKLTIEVRLLSFSLLF